MSTRCPAQVKSTAPTTGERSRPGYWYQQSYRVWRCVADGVQVVIASSEAEASALEAAYRRTGRRIDLRLDVRDRVLYVWEPVRHPSPTQRQTLYDCWYQ